MLKAYIEYILLNIFTLFAMQVYVVGDYLGASRSCFIRSPGGMRSEDNVIAFFYSIIWMVCREGLL